MRYSRMPFIKEVFEQGYGKPPTEDESRATYDVASEILKERGHHFGIGDSPFVIKEPLEKYLSDPENRAEFYRRLELPLRQLQPVRAGSEDGDKRGRDRGAAPVSTRSGRPPTPPPVRYKPTITEAERKKRLIEILEEDDEETRKVLERPPV